MPGYRPWMAGARAAAQRAEAAAAWRAREAQRYEYSEYAAESRACGYEVESFEEWVGELDPRAAAEVRLRAAERYEEGYYAD